MPSSEHSVTRRLAAILIADVVGYTRLMERDDTGTFARLRTIRDEVVDPAIVSHGGRIVKTAGDGLMAEFNSALSALRAAVHIQHEMATRNTDVPVDQRIEYRVGINLGDVMVDGSDLAGDGINVAARLETLCEPGGICVSGSVREQVHGTLDVHFDDIGEQQVKNIARPIRAFSVRFGGADARADGADKPSKHGRNQERKLPWRRRCGRPVHGWCWP
jgi:adenylate cyclase